MHRSSLPNKAAFLVTCRMKQPYVYTLPEQFLEDKSVPMRWKLYALINGFWIAGLEVFASNAFFAEKLKCTERHIQNCLEDLEKDKVLRRVGVSQQRRIVPWGTNPEFVGGRTGSSKWDEPSVRHNSDSNSDSLNSVANAPQVKDIPIDLEESPAKVSKAKYPHSKEVFALWGSYPKNWLLNTTQLRAAENLYEEQGIEEIQNALKWYEDVKNRDFCPKILSPYDLDSKWAKLEDFIEKL